MTRNEFLNVLMRLNPDNVGCLEHLNNGAWPISNLPMICTMTAAHCFVHHAWDSYPQREKDQTALRDQLRALETKGHFIFEGK